MLKSLGKHKHSDNSDDPKVITLGESEFNKIVSQVNDAFEKHPDLLPYRNRWLTWATIAVRDMDYYRSLVLTIHDKLSDEDIHPAFLHTLDDNLPPDGALFCNAEGTNLPTLFRQRNVIFVDKINVDLAAMHPTSRKLLWYQRVQDPLMLESLTPLVKLVEGWEGHNSNYNFCNLRSKYFPATAVDDALASEHPIATTQ